jgi:peptidoglycan/xylan/chitin deacetylase (PgdA/CDA1 family)
MHFITFVLALSTLRGLVTASAIPDPIPAFKQAGPAAGTVVTKCTKPDVFALAFDDGPYQYTQELVDILNAGKAKGTFFVTGILYGCIYNQAEALKNAYRSGHQIASHTWTHPYTLDSMSVEELTAQMQKLETALVNIIGVKPTYMRPPYLKTGGNVTTVMKNLGYRMITTDVDSQDWNGLTASQSQQRFAAAGPVNPDGTGHISLIHETYATSVRELVPWLINWAKENKLKMVTVGKLCSWSSSTPLIG